MRSPLAAEVDPAPYVIFGEGIDLDMRELAANLEAVLAPQIRNVILKIIKRVGAVRRGTVMPGANAGAARGCEKTRNVDIRQPTHSRHARVEGVALTTGEPTTIGADVAVVNV